MKRKDSSILERVEAGERVSDPPPAKALMVAHYFPPGTSSGTLRTVKFAKYLPQSNWEPVILTMRPDAYHPMRRDSSLLNELSTSLEVHRTAVWRPERMLANLKKRIVALVSPVRRDPYIATEETAWRSLRRSHIISDYIRDWLQFPDAYGGWLLPGLWEGYRVVKSRQIDLIYSTAPSPVSHIIAMQLKAWTGRPWVADFRDPWECLFPESVYMEGQQAWRQRAEVAVAERSIRAADIVIANTERLCVAFRKRFPQLPGRKFITIPNGFDDEDFSFSQPEPPRTESFTISHVGTFFGNLRSPDEVLRAVQALVEVGAIDPLRVCVNLVGCGAYPGRLPPYVQVNPRVSHREALQFMDHSHVLLLLQQSQKYWLQVPAKTYEYMAARRWILAIAPEGATRDLLLRLPNAVAIEPERPNELKAAIFKLYRMFVNGNLYPSPINSAFVASFSRQAQTHTLSLHFRRLLERQHGHKSSIYT